MPTSQLAESARPRGYKHGQYRTPTYNSWRAMMARCRNPRTDSYPNYGGRGISVCERWQDFANFYADMGDKPNGATLDRIDNDGDYEPGNCRWTDRSTQMRNRRPFSPEARQRMGDATRRRRSRDEAGRWV